MSDGGRDDKETTVSLTQDEEGEGGMPTVAVALSFEVLERLEEPTDAVESLQAWAEYVGVASEKPQHVVNGFCAKRDIHIDFFPGPDAGKMGTLERAREEMGLDADRHIYVGDSKRDEVMAEKTGWEYMSLDEVQRNVGWKLKDE
jgi:phosphoglycolate phosphatase-like HAD superfamily hydrolase